MGLLLAERQPKPGVEERRIGRGHKREVPRPAPVHPPLGDGGVQVADILGLVDGMARQLDPAVLPPYRLIARRADQVAGEPPVAHGRRPGRAGGMPEHVDLGPSGLGLLEGRREQLLRRPVAAMPIGEEDGGRCQVLLAERPDLERHSGSIPFHAGTRTVRAPGVPPRMTLRRRTSFVVDVSWMAPSGLARTST